MDQIEEYGNRWLQLENETERESDAKNRALSQLDEAYLALSIALLNHPLKGDLFESPIVGFLAVLGVDTER
jgi:hypothetical protein